ncbi:MAG TPA: thioredoxin [Acidimicrobiales bacterium]|nr:thioredoxin [Acidimicrobiales bacterium]
MGRSVVSGQQSRAGESRRQEEKAIEVAQELTLTDQTFDEEIQAAAEPVLVDFWAEWCGPCKMVAPILDEIADEQAGKLRVGKINIDENLELARRFDVMSIPTMILFKDGEPQVRIVGAKGKGQLLQELQAYL